MGGQDEACDEACDRLNGQLLGPGVPDNRQGRETAKTWNKAEGRAKMARGYGRWADELYKTPGSSSWQSSR